MKGTRGTPKWIREIYTKPDARTPRAAKGVTEQPAIVETPASVVEPTPVVAPEPVAIPSRYANAKVLDPRKYDEILTAAKSGDPTAINMLINGKQYRAPFNIGANYNFPQAGTPGQVRYTPGRNYVERIDGNGNFIQEVFDNSGVSARLFEAPITQIFYQDGGKLPDLSIVSSMLDSYKKGGILKAAGGGAYNNKGTDTKQGTSKPGWSNSDTNNIIDIVKLATELDSINKSNKIALDGVENAKNYIRSQQAPVINKENLNPNPIHRGAEMQRDNLNKARVVGSDSRINNAQQLAIQDRINEITDKENYAVSNAIAQNDAMNRKIDSANASARTQMNNQIAQQMTSLVNSEAHMKNIGIAQRNAALQKYLIGLQTRIDKDQMAQASMRDVVAKMNAQQQRKTAIYSKWGKEWADLSKEDKEKYGDDIDKYVQTKYPNEYSNIYTKSIYDYYNNSRPRNNSRMTVQDFGDLGLSTIPDQVETEPEVKKIRFGITSSKNGSKMRPVSDQSILDTNKEAAKVINKLSDNAVKFLLKAIK